MAEREVSAPSPDEASADVSHQEPPPADGEDATEIVDPASRLKQAGYVEVEPGRLEVPGKAAFEAAGKSQPGMKQTGPDRWEQDVDPEAERRKRQRRIAAWLNEDP